MDDPRRGGGRRPGHGRPVIPAKRLADTQEAQWVAQEDIFVLKQAKKKAEIRVKDGRARPIDWLAVTLRLIDTERDALDDEMADADLEVVDPEGVFEGLSEDQIAELEKDIDTYIALEVKRVNRDYWMTMKVICQDRRRNTGGTAPETRAVSSVAADVDKLLGPKTFEQLEVLEKQIMRKLDSNESIDVDYWEQLLRSLTVWKAKARLKRIYQSVIDARLQKLRQQQAEEAELVREKLQTILRGAEPLPDGARTDDSVDYPPILDPEGQLRIRPEDKGLEIIDEKDFLDQVIIERRRTSKMGYIPRNPRTSERPPAALASKSRAVTQVDPLRFSGVHNHDFSQATNALFEREVARGVGEDEEIFTGEEELSGIAKPQWAAKHRPRKPRYFNRVQMGYEWNKYNQTHYDHDNPPPKVVQGYKFNIFYPDLIDKTKAPTYKIHREHGRKRGQSFAPAGEEDTCLIRFVAGPPYEDVAFRIVDKEWDYSAKRERGFKSSFDKGILQLHFQFKKIYYRK